MKSFHYVLAVLIKLFNLPAHARSALVTGHIDQTATADFGQLGQQPARAAIKGGFLFRSQVQQRDQQIGRHRHESMHVQFLIGPMKLRSSGEHVGIFQIAKRGFHFQLAAIGFDDLRRAPLGADP